MKALNLKLIVCGLALGTMGLSAIAQPEPGAPRERGSGPRPDGAGRGGMQGPQLSAEKAKAAWELEATGVAKRLNLKEDQTKALVKAYTDARTSSGAAMEKARKDRQDKGADGAGPGGGGADAMKAMNDLNKAEQEKFSKAVAATLSADQAAKATASLGTFNRGWDQMVDTIASFKLDAAKQQDALNAVEDFVAAQGKARANVGPDADRDAMRTAMQASRTQLTDSLKKTLSAEQLAKFEEAMPGAGRGGRGQGGPGGDAKTPPKGK